MSSDTTPESTGAPGAHGQSGMPGGLTDWVPTPRKRLGDIVVDAMWAPREAVEQAVLEARELNLPIGRLLLDKAIITPEQLGHAVAERFGVQFVTFRDSDRDIDLSAAMLIDAQNARRLRALPVYFDDDQLVVAMADPGNVTALDDIAMLTGRRVRPVVLAEDELELTISRVFVVDSEIGAVIEALDHQPEDEQVTDLRDAGDDEGPAVKIVQSVLAQAIERGASDIHFDPAPGGMEVRFRIDGVVHQVTSIPRQLGGSVVSRLKILADLNIAERRVPQDGRVGVHVDGRRIDLRAVTLPVVEGEAVVLRILDSGGTVRTLESLGMREHDAARLSRALARTHGGILATGPTGSGKTTTVYAALQIADTGDRTLVTIEDPVEYRMAGIKQVQVNPKAGLEFATGLRAIVRADPDVILVGEIRDVTSAQIGMQAAITGHLVLSTLHTNDAATAISRLVDMGVPPFMVASAVSCVVGQRLARRLCDHCKQPATVPGRVVDGDEDEVVDVFEPVGCASCADTGYSGRVGLYEVLEMSDELRKLAVADAGADEITRVARAEGMTTIREDGIARVRAGLTSVAELTRVAPA